jgi:hypothetical protein
MTNRTQLITLYFVALTIILLSACGGRPGAPFIRRIYYTGGHVKSEEMLVHNMKNGEATYYFGKKEKYSIYMDEYFKNGQLDSTFTEYYPNGLRKETGMYNYGHAMGSFHFYYPDGRLKAYNACGYDGRIFYAIFYDTAGSITYRKGIAIVKTAGNLSADTIHHIGDTLHFIWAIAQPPHCSNTVTATVSKKDSDRTTLIVPPTPCRISRSCIEMKRAFDQPGNYIIIAKGALLDSVTNSTSADSSVVEITVQANK